MDEQVHDLRFVNGRGGGEFARRRRPRQDEDSRADDGADAERGERDGAERLFQARLRVLRIGDEFVDGFLSEELAAGNFAAPYSGAISQARNTDEPKLMADS